MIDNNTLILQVKYKEQGRLTDKYLDKLINAAIFSGIKDREWPKFIVYSTEISIYIAEKNLRSSKRLEKLTCWLYF